MTADIPMESKVVERQWNTTFQVLEGKKKKKLSTKKSMSYINIFQKRK